MKLKKIASLALAGVMAVSMLAGCSTASNGGNNGGEGEGEGEGTVVSGYSSVLGEALKNVDCIKDKDYITFQDNAADEAALQTAVDAVEAEALEDYATTYGAKLISGDNGDFYGDTSKRMEKIFVNGAKISDDDLKSGDIAMAWYAGYNNNKPNGYSKFINTSAKDGVLYVVNGAVTVEQAVKMVAEKIEDQLKNAANALPETNAKPDDCKTCAGYGSYKYNYTISVSVVDKTQQSDYDQASNFAHFIAVTVSRTAKVA